MMMMMMMMMMLATNIQTFLWGNSFRSPILSLVAPAVLWSCRHLFFDVILFLIAHKGIDIFSSHSCSSDFSHLFSSFLYQLYMYQLFRSLSYIHLQGICHRDIKPQNLLLNPELGILKLCDFGRLVSCCCRKAFHRRGDLNGCSSNGMWCRSWRLSWCVMQWWWWWWWW